MPSNKSDSKENKETLTEESKNDNNFVKPEIQKEENSAKIDKDL